MDNPFQAPDSPVIQQKTTADPLLPSRWRRLAAALIDMAISMVFAIFFMLHQIQVLEIPYGEPVPFEQNVVGFIYSIVVFLVINGYLLAKRGQTVGKLALGLKIATAYYTKPGIFRLTFIRTFPFWLLSYHPLLALVGLLDVLMIFGKSKRCLHDHVATTVVVDQSVSYNPG